MERDALINALLRPDAASQACSAALAGGADFKVWEQATDTPDLIRIYRQKAKHVVAAGLEHGGFDQALADLEACAAGAVRLGRVTDQTARRHYQLFLATDVDELVACLWVHHDS